MKRLFLVLALLLAACLLVVGVRSDRSPDKGSESVAFKGPSFDLQIEKPRAARPLFGLLPSALEAKLLEGEDLQFDEASPGAQVLGARPDRLELSADGWHFLIEIHDDELVRERTNLLFPMNLAGTQRNLRCRPAARTTGYLRTSRAGVQELDGRFLVELASCEIAETGVIIDWPSAPLTVRGSFTRLPDGPS